MKLDLGVRFKDDPKVYARNHYRLKHGVPFDAPLWGNARNIAVPCKIKGKQNPEYMRQYFLLVDYGLTLKDYKGLLQEQHFRCAICETPFHEPFSRNAHIDHKDDTVRGLLCRSCNMNLGVYEKFKKDWRVERYLSTTGRFIKKFKEMEKK